MTTDERQYMRGYECGWRDGYHTGVEDGYSKGYDEGIEALAAEVRNHI
jgi:flagellar biosynthesis/type III secretory pathway protein FliH